LACIASAGMLWRFGVRFRPKTDTNERRMGCSSQAGFPQLCYHLNSPYVKTLMAMAARDAHHEMGSQWCEGTYGRA
jgi:hypothetical protein